MLGFDMFCLMTRLEASGTVYLEAASAKLPVIGTAVGGVPEMLIDGVTGFLVKLDDDQGLRDIITTLIENPSLRRKMGDAGYDRIWKIQNLNLLRKHWCGVLNNATDAGLIEGLTSASFLGKKVRHDAHARASRIFPTHSYSHVSPN